MDIFSIAGTIAIKTNDAYSQLDKVQSAASDTAEELGNVDKEAGNASGSIQQTGSAASSANEGFTIWKATIANLVSNAISALISKCTELAGKMADLVKQSVSNYANYEQQVGGIQTLYGDAANSMISNAERAYQSAGMSASMYMETATSFGASLVSSLGGDTAEAAKVADRAITDMSDNANKMGTDISSIQDAYQGFAKQNYTMLDNLKLGYGGTQSEMQRLIEHAASLTDVQEDLGVTVDGTSMSFDNICNAISVVQKEMGITGTTFDEAGTTISGSWGSVQALFENILTKVGSQLKPTIMGFLNQLSGWMENMDWDAFAEQIGNAFGTALEWIQQIDFTTFFQNAVTALLAFIEGLGQFVTWIVNVINWCVQYRDILSVVAQVIGVVVTAIGTFSAINKVVEMVKTAASVFQGLWSVLTANPITIVITVITALVAVIVTLWNTNENFRNVLTSAWEQIQTLAAAVWPQIQSVLETVWNAIQAAAAAVWPVIQSVIETVMTTVQSLIETAWPVIQNNVETSMAVIQSVIETAWPVIQSAIETVMTVIQSVIETVWPVIQSVIETTVSVIQTIIETTWPVIQTVIETAISAIQTVVTTAWPIIQTIMETAMNVIQTVVQTVWPIIQTVVQSVMIGIQNTIETVGPIIQSVFETVMPAIQSIIETVWPIVQSAIETAMGAVQSVIETVCPIIESIVETVMGAIQSVFETVWPAVQTAVENPVKAIQSLIETVWPAIQSATDTVMNAIQNVVETVWPIIQSAVETAANAVQSVIEVAWPAIQSAIDTASTAIQTVTQTVWPAVQSAVQTAVNFISSLVTGVWNTLKTLTTTVWNGIQTAIQNPIQTAKNTVTTAINGIKGVVTPAWNTLKSVTTGAWNGIKTAIKTPIETARDLVKGAIDKMKGFFKFSWSLPKLKMPHISISGSFSISPPSVPHFSISWYKKAMDNPLMFTSPTLFDVNPATGAAKAAGEAGDEVMIGKDTMLNMIQQAVAAETASMQDNFDRLVEMVSEFFPEVLDNLGREVVLDTGTLVGEIAPDMDTELGKLYRKKGR